MQAPPARPRLATLAVAVSFLLLLPSTAEAGWSQFHAGPARLGTSADTTLRPGNLGRLEVLWSRRTGATQEGINSSPAVAGDVVFVGSDDGRLWAFGARRGKVLWSKPARGKVRSSPAVSDGKVYAGSNKGWLLARGTGSGRLLWERNLGGKITAPPLLAENRVYVGSRGGSFFALNADTGRTIWRRDTWGVWDAAAYRGGTVFVGSDHEKVWALDADSGRTKWVTDVWGRVRSTPAVTRSRVYIGTDMGRVYALDRGSGRKVWYAAAVKPGNGFVRCAPAVAEGRVYVSVGLTTTPMDGALKAFDAGSGALRWTGELADYSTSSPAFANGIVWVGSFDHQLYAFDADTGNEIWSSGWQYEGGFFERGISSSPALALGRVYVGVRDGRMYSLGIPGA